MAAAVLVMLICAPAGRAGPHGGMSYDVTDYGAVPDDGGDDSGAITAAMSAADPNAGDYVFIPGGTFHIGSTLVVPAGLKIAGAGRDRTVIEYTGNEQVAMISLNGVDGVEVAHLALRGNGYCTKGIVATDGGFHYLHDLLIEDFTSAEETFILGIHFGRDVTNSEITGNIIRNIGVGSTWGGGIRMSWGSSGNRILRNTITDTGRGGIFADNDSHSNIIRENTVTSSGKTAESLGIEVWGGCPYSVIEDNVIDHWLSVDSSDYSAIRRNTIEAADSTLAGYGLELVASKWCVFTDNTVGEGAHIGISVSGSSPKENIYWAYNTIRHCTTWGMQMQGEDGGASYHYFYENTFAETYKNHPEALYPPQGHGLRFNGNDFFITFEANTIADNGNAALQFLGDLDSFSFVNNIISGNVRVVYGAFGGSNFEFSGNTVENNSINNPPASQGFDNDRPAAGFTYTMNGDEVRFYDASNDPDGTIEQYLWDFNDGIPSSETNPVHVFPGPGEYRVALVVWDNDGRGARSERIVTTPGEVMVEEESTGIALVPFSLEGNFPNPFNGSTTIAFMVSLPRRISVTCYTVTGQKVATVTERYYQPGEHIVGIDLSGMPSGVYFYRLAGSGQEAWGKMLFLR